MDTTPISEMTTDELTNYCAQEYKRLSAMKKHLDTAQKELYKRMAENNLKEVQSPFGRFISYVRSSYTFPEDVKALKDQVAAAEELAIAEGRAVKEEKTFYKFAEVKKEDQF